MDRRTAVKNIALSIGLTISGSTIFSVLQSCNSKEFKNSLIFFNKEEMQILEKLIDILLPQTSTIGGNDLYLAQFVDKMCAHTLNYEKQNTIKLGVEKFSNYFQTQFGIGALDGSTNDYEKLIEIFFNVSEDKKAQVFKLIQEDYKNISKQRQSNYLIYSFLITVRELSFLGYFTSQEVI